VSPDAMQYHAGVASGDDAALYETHARSIRLTRHALLGRGDPLAIAMHDSARSMGISCRFFVLRTVRRLLDVRGRTTRGVVAATEPVHVSIETVDLFPSRHSIQRRDSYW
jgi:hypothetical protein